LEALFWAGTALSFVLNAEPSSMLTAMLSNERVNVMQPT
jgi:hypothetical protein